MCFHVCIGVYIYVSVYQFIIKLSFKTPDF